MMTVSPLLFYHERFAFLPPPNKGRIFLTAKLPRSLFSVYARPDLLFL